VLDLLLRELAAVKGRWFLPKQIPTQGKDYLQIGSGDSRLEGFLNSGFGLHSHAEVLVDARFPLRFPDKRWRGIYAHHIVEHISYPDAFHLFRECRRTLMPNGVFRMVVPNLEKFINLYASDDTAERTQIFGLYPDHIMSILDAKTPLEILDYIFRDNKFNRHLSAWDWETAQVRLKEAGFSKVVRQSVNMSLDPILAGHDKPHWAQFSLYVEAVK
jgi:predicted SAM-dependent methyltransferase